LALYHITVIGSGVVGTATGKGLHKLGHDVVFYDISKQRLAALKEEGYEVASSLEDAIYKSDISFVCVNTPQNNELDAGKEQDLSQLLTALHDIATALNNDIVNKKHLLVFRSTMLPGSMRNVVIDYLERNCNLKRGKDYDVCHNPEFLRQHNALEDFLNPDRIVIGEDTKGSSLPLRDIYSPLTKNIIITTYETSELIKYASNCFLSLKISYFNEIAMICKRIGINDEEVSLGVSLDRRIGKYGTQGGRPFDGACLPKDSEAMALFVKKIGIKPDLIQMTLDINEEIKEYNSAKQVCIEDFSC
jgi:UDPglucose 6-dehydrogenase